jgi:predicted RNA-binding protein Jag
VGVADRVWLVTLSEKQEKLVLSTGHYVEVVKMITSERRVVA